MARPCASPVEFIVQARPGAVPIVRVSQDLDGSSFRSRFSCRRSLRLFWAFFFGFSLLMILSCRVMLSVFGCASGALLGRHDESVSVA